MDYGQTKQPSQPVTPQGFFTSGVGTNNPDSNSFESENNLDTTNGEWNMASERNARNIGSSALLSDSESPIQSKEPDIQSDVAELPNLGMPPIETISEATPTETANDNPSLKKEDFVQGDRIRSQGIALLKGREAELAKDNNIDKFYDFVSEIREKIQGQGEKK